MIKKALITHGVIDLSNGWVSGGKRDQNNRPISLIHLDQVFHLRPIHYFNLLQL